MKIKAITVWRVDLPYVGGAYVWSKGATRIADTTVVRIDTDEGVSGFGECCPLGSNYLPAFAGGVRAGIEELSPHLLGRDPCAIGAINDLMDFHMEGHPYVKSAIDIACHDILGKSAGLPVHALLGGRRIEAMPMYRAVPSDEADTVAGAVARFREQGYRQFQLKAGLEPEEDIERIRMVHAQLQPGERLLADGNRGWRRIDAIRVAETTRELSYVLEQPCALYQDCRSVRARASQPFKLDESLLAFEHLVRAHRDDALDMACIKVSRFGGLTASRLARDYCVAWGLPMTVEDAWGGEIVTAAHAHLAASTPPAMLLNTTDLHHYNTVSLGRSTLSVEDGHLLVGDAPGLGVEPDEVVLGDPVAVYD